MSECTMKLLWMTAWHSIKINACMNEWSNEWMSYTEWMHIWMTECMYDSWMNESMNGWSKSSNEYHWMNERMDTIEYGMH